MPSVEKDKHEKPSKDSREKKKEEKAKATASRLAEQRDLISDLRSELEALKKQAESKTPRGQPAILDQSAMPAAGSYGPWQPAPPGLEDQWDHNCDPYYYPDYYGQHPEFYESGAYEAAYPQPNPHSLSDSDDDSEVSFKKEQAAKPEESSDPAKDPSPQPPPLGGVLGELLRKDHEKYREPPPARPINSHLAAAISRHFTLPATKIQKDNFLKVQILLCIVLF